jgi:hypothetical protein
MFGGLNGQNEPNNELYLLKPNYYENKEMFSTNANTFGHFKKKLTPHVNMTIEKVKTQGEGPSPRFSHAACYI